jgi:hypothetical protein
METFWICPWCKQANFRECEGLDECERCGSETRVALKAFEDRMVVKMAREPSLLPEASERAASLVALGRKIADSR